MKKHRNQAPEVIVHFVYDPEKDEVIEAELLVIKAHMSSLMQDLLRRIETYKE